MSVSRALIAEAMGSMLLAAAVVGSGIMAQQLSGGIPALALLANTIATIATLAALIALFEPISGAHFNPLVSLTSALTGRLAWSTAAAFALTQTVGCCAGTLLAHGMFAMPLLQVAVQPRPGIGRWLGEVVATFGLILICLRPHRPGQSAWTVAAWIGGAYWFTSSTSFANPAITVARSLTDSFSGIRPQDVPAFILAQTSGALGAWAIAVPLFRSAAVAYPDDPSPDSGTIDSDGRRLILK